MTAPASRSRAGTRLRIAAFAALALAAAAVAYVWASPRDPGWDTAVLRRGDIESSVTAIGTLQPRRYVDVGAQVSGQILRLHVQPGDAVKKGQLMVEIDPSVQQATVDAGRASLAGLRAQLADQHAQHRLARQQFARQQQMAAGYEAWKAGDCAKATPQVRRALERGVPAEIEGVAHAILGVCALGDSKFDEAYASLARATCSADRYSAFRIWRS